MKKNISIHEICMVGLMAAAVYVASAFIQIPIPTAIDNTRIHMGNVMCLLSGLLLGPVWGGMAAGIGSMFFDLTNPAYVTSAPFTFVFKFLMAWICGTAALGRNRQGMTAARGFFGGILGNGAYVVLYLTKGFIENYYVLHMPIEGVLASTVQKGIVSTANAVIAVIVAVPLSLAMKPAVQKLLAAYQRS